jgi:endonuclease G
MLGRLLLASLLLVVAGCEQPQQATPTGATPQASGGPFGLTRLSRSDLAACAAVATGQPPQVAGKRIVPLCEADGRKVFFASGYSVRDMRSIWSAYRLTRAKVKAIEESDLDRSGLAFRQNQQLKDERVPQPTTDDYKNSGYQRGHYVPAEASKWDEDALRASFQVTNIAPQNGGMNGSIWRCYEETIRDWAKDFGAVEVVVGGSVRTDGSIGDDNKITVPAHFFAIVYRPDTRTAVGVAVPNEDGFRLDVRHYMRPVATVEQMAGITVDLPANVKSAPVRFADWPVKVAQIPFFDASNRERNECVSPSGPPPVLVSQAH